ncbi:MAG: hypothetical protein IGQ45_08275 [Cyanobacterium sp. T60_A2020_053]|nr:hypothetical protein [Cyanobacterium sp. T60_A2020_053]
MSQSEKIIHPLISATIKSLDLDLTFELNRYEGNWQGNHPILASTSEDQLGRGALVQKSSENNLNEQKISPQKSEEDPIPVASRIITPQQKLGEIIFTPWGIFGLIIFIATNAIIVINPNLFNFLATKNSLDNEEIISQNNSTPEENLSLTEPKITDNLTTIINQPQPNNINLLPAPVIPPLNPNEVKQEQSNQDRNANQNLYPDLQSALLSEALLHLAESGITVTPAPNQNQSSSQYYLITNYENPQQFSRIKQSIPSALVTKIDQEMKIQLKIFTDKNEAEKQKETWQNLGIEINIIP